ncbi:hypothetical protein APR41_01995 [Salegentibacter salinarum]|uniref:Uncharacterized protein n=1 Tax=Salegentibacter salinarum TaxID=447422 RepID=A0A2N0U464_9FLAO|nr:hypothetical protein [Salegentibacter salinarum]PKD21774.1 hypothetical protein APR41_01995 [Salegentibacter salinarum]SKB33745.1 hypothetical protein SAMN05660903_00160 [Salegentibacter salinarum]
MYKINGTPLLVIGMMLTALGSTILSDHTFLQYIALFLGLIFSIFSVFLSDKVKKAEMEKAKIHLTTGKN